MIALYILLAVFVFGFMIFIHELGHFMFAKKFKVAINEFSIGMGPKIFSKVGKTKKCGTCYTTHTTHKSTLLCIKTIRPYTFVTKKV